MIFHPENARIVHVKSSRVVSSGEPFYCGVVMQTERQEEGQPVYILQATCRAPSQALVMAQALQASGDETGTYFAVSYDAQGLRWIEIARG